MTINFPRLHVIAPLLKLCEEAGYEGAEALSDVVTLTRFAVITRYPGEEESVSSQEARQALMLAEKVLNWVETQLT